MTAGALPMDPQALDLCAVEPIHIPGSIQPHGALLVVAPLDFRILQASANAGEMLGAGIRLGAGLADAIGGSWVDELHAWSQQPGEPALMRTVQLPSGGFQLSAHLTAQGLQLEFEPSRSDEAATMAALYPHLRRFVDSVEAESDIGALGQLATDEVRRITGFHRVMVYAFDEDWHGTVVAESGDGSLPSYLDLRFPASDIPAQARDLYRRSRLRLIPDARYEPVPVLPALSPLDGQPLDLSAVALRSVSPVHLEYMRNMGTDASMSVSIVIDGKLWGLISCHHAAPRRVGPEIRGACDFLGQILSLQLGALSRGAEAAQRLALKDREAELLARVSRSPSVPAGLAENPEAWLALAGASGAAVLMDDVVLSAGRTPPIDQLKALAAWLRRRPDEAVFASHALATVYRPAAEFVDVGSGLLAVPISALHPHYILWFRPELVQTVRWGGQPGKVDAGDGRLHPRRSFALWTEQLRGQSARWSRVEVDAVESFRNAVVNFVLRRAEERAELTGKLEATNRELEAFSYSVSHDLRAPFRHIVGFAQLLADQEKGLSQRSRHYVDSIVDSALSAGQLVDDLLSFSQLGRSALDMTRVDMAKLAAEVRRTAEPDAAGRAIEWRIGPLPPAWGDGALLRQILANLVDNAIKYTRDRDPAVIEISGEDRAHETVYAVRDNGVGFDMAYSAKLFGVFQRLHRAEEFEGSGIGLALARRIVDRHGGWITAEGRLNEGALFRFGVPKPGEQGHSA
jgi:light-regulated signal transduction histidine kinase (bacteriophytochrome)